MPIGVQDFKILSADQANPLGEALYKAMLSRKAKMDAATSEAELPYAGLSKAAQAASQLTYAKMMGPQFLAKMMGNENLLANMDNPKQKLDALSGSGGQPSIADSVMQYWMQNEGMGGQGSAPQQPQMPQQRPQQMSMPVGNEARGGQGMPSFNGGGGGYRGGNPGDGGMAEDYPDSQGSPIDFAENVGTFKGRVEQGKKTGELNAETINNLNDVAFSARSKDDTFKQLGDVLTSPVFDNMRKLPGEFGSYELGYIKNHGTKAEQQAAGNFITLTGNVVRDTAQDFKGQFRVGEQQLVNNMKVNEKDTVDTAKGKLEMMQYLNTMLGQRAKIAAQLMDKHKISKADALEAADKMVDGSQVRKAIHEGLNPPSKQDRLSNEMSQQGFKVKMRSPDGRTAMVHEEDVQSAEQEGWSHA